MNFRYILHSNMKKNIHNNIIPVFIVLALVLDDPQFYLPEALSTAAVQTAQGAKSSHLTAAQTHFFQPDLCYHMPELKTVSNTHNSYIISIFFK